jgi:hypothetical protein
MLRMMSWRMFLEWKTFSELEPFEDVRADFNASHIVQALLRDGRKLGEYLLPFGDAEAYIPQPTQTVEYQEQMIDAWIFGSNAAFAARDKGIR